MKILFLSVFLVSCNSVPWLATDREVERAVQDALHDAETFSIDGDARIVNAARAEGVALAAYQPPVATPISPPMDPGVDWIAVLQTIGVMAGGSAGALGYRYIDHKRKALQAAQASQEA